MYYQIAIKITSKNKQPKLLFNNKKRLVYNLYE